LMGFIGIVLAGAVSFFVFLAKRAAATPRAESTPPPPSQPQA
jgi:hypothetical protein